MSIENNIIVAREQIKAEIDRETERWIADAQEFPEQYEGLTIDDAKIWIAEHLN